MLLLCLDAVALGGFPHERLHQDKEAASSLDRLEAPARASLNFSISASVVIPVIGFIFPWDWELEESEDAFEDSFAFFASFFFLRIFFVLLDSDIYSIFLAYYYLQRFAIQLGTKFWVFREQGAGSREVGSRKSEVGTGKTILCT
ncbi:MAG: hypothetical protein F6K44_08890, partial [Moorea sp. SIO3E2]|nr:hypothetical protein [Moorena sp. SIO3E2]